MTISTLLVANRGEIAVRVIRGARALGIRTVAVYSDADEDSPHVHAADVAVRIGPTPAASSYLDIDALLAAARETGADAVHPGYGFLSERADFARAVVAAGLTFVGPTPEVIEQMGRKDAARRIAIDAGVPVVPEVAVPTGSMTAELSADSFPALVKAAAGGGGRGMRVVRSADELPAALEAAGREAVAAFGDGTLLVERYVEHGRHVEMQVLGDQYGNVVHLFERDCSAQRRHQKVLEEAPAPNLSDNARKILHESAVALARSVGYTSAGTVEYLVSGRPGEEEVFFLEMNTRLQVEHPVTEAITGLDLVQAQLRIAMGEPLGFTQEDIICTGHAIEARVCAEDAFGGFLPQAGVASLVRWPERARVEACLESGQEVGLWYDSMVGKVIVHGSSREAARLLLLDALDDTVILGLTTNTGFLRKLAASAEFRDAAVHTSWLDEEALPAPAVDAADQYAAWAIADEATSGDSPFGAGDGWRLGGLRAAVTVRLDDRAVTAALPRPAPAAACVRVGERSVDIALQGHWFHLVRPQAGDTSDESPTDGAVTAPMPGTVQRIEVALGEVVAEGQVLAVLEAMKMEMPLKAPHAGSIVEIGAATGDQVALRQTLFVVEADA